MTVGPPLPPAPVYDTIGRHYTAHRQADPRWEALITHHLGGARTVVNVGAGTGSYEPGNLRVLAVEPSAVMVGQRPGAAAPALRGSGTCLPLATGSFDAALAILTMHHWGDWRAGVDELCRVAPRRIILTIDFDVHARFWLLDDYLPPVADHVRRQVPTLAQLVDRLPGARVEPLALPRDFGDGVLGAHWRRPEAYLDPVVRANCSPLALADQRVVDAGVARLEDELRSGAWHERHGDLLALDELDLGYRLVVSG